MSDIDNLLSQTGIDMSNPDFDVIVNRLKSLKYKPKYDGVFFHPDNSGVKKFKREIQKKYKGNKEKIEEELLYRQAASQLSSYNKGFIKAHEI